MEIRGSLANTTVRPSRLDLPTVKSGQPLGAEIICCPSAIAIGAREHDSPSVQPACPIPVLPWSTSATGYLIQQPTSASGAQQIKPQVSQPARPAGFEPATRCLEGSDERAL
jgi:hypothetical protein